MKMKHLLSVNQASISIVTGANPHEVRTSRDCAPGADCRVDNAAVGNAIQELTKAAVVT